MQVAHNLVKELIKYLRKNDNRLTTLQRISVVMVSVFQMIYAFIYLSYVRFISSKTVLI